VWRGATSSGTNHDARLPRRSVNRSHPRWGTLIGVVAGLAAFAATAALALTHHGAEPELPLAPLSAVGHIRPAPVGGRLGPEGVPIPTGPSLAPPRRLRIGEQIDGISCQPAEQVAFHIHAHLQIIVRGRSRQVPAGIGAAPHSEVEPTRAGPFVTGASCFMWLHTHAADGIVHMESPARRTYTLGQFFDVWGRSLGRGRVGPARGAVTAFVDGRVFSGDPRTIPLTAHGQIELEVGRPLVAPDLITFPRGL
jgi:hypothetical protein